MNDVRTRYKGDLLRIGIQCGITDHRALEKFIEIIAKRVQDRKTGVWYDPEEEFDKLMDTPEVKAQMERMKFG